MNSMEYFLRKSLNGIDLECLTYKCSEDGNIHLDIDENQIPSTLESKLRQTTLKVVQLWDTKTGRVFYHLDTTIPPCFDGDEEEFVFGIVLVNANEEFENYIINRYRKLTPSVEVIHYNPNLKDFHSVSDYLKAACKFLNTLDTERGKGRKLLIVWNIPDTKTYKLLNLGGIIKSLRPFPAFEFASYIEHYHDNMDIIDRRGI